MRRNRLSPFTQGVATAGAERIRSRAWEVILDGQLMPLSSDDYSSISRMATAALKTADQQPLARTIAFAIRESGNRARFEAAELVSAVRQRSPLIATRLVGALAQEAGANEAALIETVEYSRGPAALWREIGRSGSNGYLYNGLNQFRGKRNDDPPPKDFCLEEWVKLREATQAVYECLRAIQRIEEYIQALKEEMAQLENDVGSYPQLPSPPGPPPGKTLRRKMPWVIGDLYGTWSAYDSWHSGKRARLAELRALVREAEAEKQRLQDRLDRLEKIEAKAAATYEHCCRENGGCRSRDNAYRLKYPA